MYELKFAPAFVEEYEKLDSSVKKRINKKLFQLKHQQMKRRHLRLGEPYFVEEIGQYRIVYMFLEKEKKIVLEFVGMHKDYEKFLGID